MSNLASKRVRQTPAQWQQMFARFNASGLSVVEFCRRNSVSVANFYRWRLLLAGAKPAPANVVSSFLELPSVVMPPPSHRWQIELDLGDGIVLRLAR